jgi:DNA-binding response OmpR family regulator
MVRNPQIIVYGQDKTLLDTRAWVLQTAGFEVGTATDLNEIESLSTTRTVELLILCHTLSPVQVSSAIALSRSDKSNIGQLLIISGPTTPITETPYPTMNPFSGPNAFIESVRDLVTS